jgi:endonuclease/exonuclease/phosphatase (EEP) superfamily protein YafD
MNLGYLSIQIYPYLPFATKQIQSASPNQEPDIKILISNVFQDNNDFEKLNSLVHEMDADIVLLLETNQWWREKCLEGFGDKYEFRILEDKENTYGMLIFSKFTLSNNKVRYLIKEKIPSIVTDVTLKNKRTIKFFALHPEPPIPTENPHSTDRDAEILLIGKEVEHEKSPLIVAGDLNDVAWSYSSTLFQKISGLLDPRRGRGFFSSFHAKYPFFRWPLDHIFCSGHFRVHQIKRMRNIGSDHFPIYISLHLTPVEDDSKKLVADADDKKLADEKIEKAL